MTAPVVSVVPHKVQVVITPRALDIDTACRVYGVSRDTLAVWRDEHGFPAVRVGRKVLIPVAQADAWLAERVTTGAPK